jgi:hypothetical protein
MTSYESIPPYEPEPAPEPTNEELDESMKSVANQFGEEFESYSSIVRNMERDGWRLADVLTNTSRVTAEEQPDREIKIIGQGTKFLVFERERPK